MNHALNAPFHCVHSNFCAATDFELLANSESGAVYKPAPESFSPRLSCSHFILFWSFKPTLEYIQGTPWEVWKHNLAFQSFQCLRAANETRCSLWCWGSLYHPAKAQCTCSSPGSLDYLSKVGGLGSLPPPRSSKRIRKGLETCSERRGETPVVVEPI